jgi:hypothetical protein
VNKVSTFRENPVKARSTTDASHYQPSTVRIGPTVEVAADVARGQANAGQPPDERVRRLAARCRAVLGDLTLLPQPPGYPGSLALCVLDAIWSMGVRYTAVEHAISRYRKHRRSQGADPDRDSLADLLATSDHAGSGKGLAELLGNHQRTATRNGVLKADAVAIAARMLASQAVTTMNQVIVAAELTCEANDVHQLDPMLKATATILAAAGVDERPEALLADSGYWSIDDLTAIPNASELLIPPARHGRQGKPRKDGKPSASKSDGLRAAMKKKLASEDGKARYAKRRETVEPVFGQIKEQQGARRFLRRGRRACQAEWKLLCGTHNLLKLWRHTVTPRAARPATA